MPKAVKVGGVYIEVRADDGKAFGNDLKARETAAKRAGMRTGRAFQTAHSKIKPIAGELGKATRKARLFGSTTSAAFRQSQGAAQRFERTLSGMGTALGIGVGVAGGGLVAKGVVERADAYARLQDQLGLVIGSQERLGDVEENLFANAQRNRRGLLETARLYVGIRDARGDIDDEQGQRILEGWNRTLRASGSTASESAAATLQFAQALSKGKLDGDEFRSVLENNRVFARLLQEQLGVTRGALFEMAPRGELQLDAILAPLLDDSGELADRVGQLRLKVDEAVTQVSNALLRYVGQMDQGLGASERFAGGISKMAENFDEVAQASGLLIAAIGGPALLRASSRGVESLNQRTAASHQATSVNRAYAQSVHANAIAVSRAASVEASSAQAVVRKSAAHVAAATTTKLRTRALEAHTAALARDAAAQTTLSAAQVNVATTARAASVAMGSMTNGARIAAVSMSALRGAMAFLGGPIGLGILAVSAAVWGLSSAYNDLNGTSARVLESSEDLLDISRRLISASSTDRSNLIAQRDALLETARAEVVLARARLQRARHIQSGEGRLGVIGDRAVDGARHQLEATQAALETLQTDIIQSGQEMGVLEISDSAMNRVMAIERELADATGSRRDVLEEQRDLYLDQLRAAQALLPQFTQSAETSLGNAIEAQNTTLSGLMSRVQGVQSDAVISAREQLNSLQLAGEELARVLSGERTTPSVQNSDAIQLLQLSARMQVARLSNNAQLANQLSDQIQLIRSRQAYERAGQSSDEARLSAQRDLSALQDARNQALQSERTKIEEAWQIEIARALGDQTRLALLQREGSLRDRINRLIATGIERSQAESQVAQNQLELDEAREFARTRVLDAMQDELTLQVARIEQDHEAIRSLERNAELERLIAQYRRTELSLTQATARAQADLLRLEEARQGARAQALDDMRAEHELELARLRGERERVRLLERAAYIQERTSRYRDEGQLSRSQAQARATNEADQRFAAEQRGQFREAFKSSLTEALDIALREGDWGSAAAKFGIGIAEHFADKALNELADTLFDSIFGQFNAAAEGTTQGVAASLPISTGMISAGGTAALAISGAMTAAGATAAAAIATAMVAGGVTGAAGDAASSGAGSFFSSLMGFNSGASFKVGGAGGTDNNLVAFKASRGERVDVLTGAQQKLQNLANVSSQAGGEVHVYFNLGTGSDANSIRRARGEIASDIARAVQLAQRNM
ncbi:MAG: tape measure protein [Maricaulis sp.]|nr:tape measure protein [Maricaulis sp.]